MTQEGRAKQTEEMLRNLAEWAGQFERTTIYPGAEVVDAAFTANRILVRGREEYYEPVLMVPGVTYTNGDLVTVLYILGTEPMALAQSPGSGSAGTLDVIDSYTATGPVASITISGIPPTYRHLEISGIARGTIAGTGVWIGIRFNGDSGNNYDYVNHWASSAANGQNGGQGVSSAHIIHAPGSSASSASMFGSFLSRICNYTGGYYKTFHGLCYMIHNTGLAQQYVDRVGGDWRSTSVINSMTIYSTSGGNLDTGTQITLYGVR